MQKNKRKKKLGWLKAHVEDIIRCPEWNNGKGVRLKGLTSDGCMEVENFHTHKVEVLPKEYLEYEWKFG